MAGVPLGQPLPDGVELATREKPGMKIVFVLNYTDKAQTVNLGRPSTNALTGEKEAATLEIPVFDVRVVIVTE
jgi:beta-galactosidase GanA